MRALKGDWPILRTARFLWVALIALLAGCQTTGNPREGGLFGWRESQAQERQAALEAESAAAKKAADAEIRKGEALNQRQGQLNQQAASLQAQLGRLLAENDSLDNEVRGLMSKRQLSATELSRLQGTLAASEKARAAARRAAAQAPAAQSTAVLNTHADTVDQYNKALQREVLLLMGR